MRKAAQKKTDLLFHFDDPIGRRNGTGKAKTAFKNAGYQVADLTVNDKIQKSAGVKYRSIVFAFHDSQKVEVWLKESGDVFKVKLNGREFPVAEQDNHRKAVKEIAVALEAGSTAFQKKLAKAKMITPAARKTSNANTLKFLEQKNRDLDEAIEATTAEIEQYRAAA